MTMPPLSETERITLLMMYGYGDRVRSLQEVCDLFNNTFRNREPITKSTVSKTVRRFEETGTVNNRPRTGRPRTVTTDAKSLDVLQTFVEDPHSSIRKAIVQHDISFSSVQKILKTNKFHPYKLHLVQELSEDDFDRRVEYCDTVMQKLDIDENFSNSIVFSDEATFMLNGDVNKQNCRYWSDNNPRWMMEAHTQHPQKVNVWAGIVGDCIVGPFILDDNLTGEAYCDLLANRIIPNIRQKFGQELYNNLWFQQDWAPPHYYLRARQILNEQFPNRWIGRRGAIEWPARSPDLSPLDYFFWGYLKHNVYKTKPADINELKRRIIDESARVPPDMIQKVTKEYYSRLAHCQAVEGKHFEHLL